MVFLLLLGLIAGTMVPIQTSINSRLIEYTKSSFYASTISFAVGSLFLIIVNLIVNPGVLTLITIILILIILGLRAEF